MADAAYGDAAAVTTTSGICYAVLKVNYGITIGAVLLFAIAGLPAPAVALHRAPAIALGSDVWRPCFDIVHQIGLSWECDWRSIC
jgi:hypothetical protein